MTLPNPGSDEAIALGCSCPVLDNNHGKHVPWQGGYIIVRGCPAHPWPTDERKKKLCDD